MKKSFSENTIRDAVIEIMSEFGKTAAKIDLVELEIPIFLKANSLDEDSKHRALDAIEGLVLDGFLTRSSEGRPNSLIGTDKCRNAKKAKSLDLAVIVGNELGKKIYDYFYKGDTDNAVFAVHKNNELKLKNKTKKTLNRPLTNQESKPFELCDLALCPKNGCLKHTTESPVYVHAFVKGAIGLFKNKGSHDEPNYSVAEAVRLIAVGQVVSGLIDGCVPKT